MTTKNIILLAVGTVVVIAGIATVVTIRNRRRVSAEAAAEAARKDVKTIIVQKTNDKGETFNQEVSLSETVKLSDDWKSLLIAPENESIEDFKKRMDAIVLFAEKEKNKDAA